MVDNNDDDRGSSYEAAVSALLSPIHQATTPQALREAGLRRTNTLQDMQVYLHRLGLNLNGADANATSHEDDKGDNCNNYCSSKEGIAATTQANNEAGNTKNGNNYHIPSLIFHVTGTKGKGSTLSFCESILRNAYGLNTGLFTSPHLVDIRERIRINSVPISKQLFGEVYWSVRHKLETAHDDNIEDVDANHHLNGEDEGNTVTATSLPPLPTLPGYFRMLTLMALYTFCRCQTRPKIDVILLEVGMGGRYDATNVFEPTAPHPTSSSSNNHDYEHEISSQTPNNERRMLVRGITLIDYDHTRILGSTLSQIAWEKGGIYMQNKLHSIGRNDGGYERFVADRGKTITTATASSNNGEGRQTNNNLLSPPPPQLATTMQPIVFVSGNNSTSSEVLPVLDRIAKCNGCQLQVVHDALSSIEPFPRIGLQGSHQRSNAALALAMCRYAMNQRQHSPTPSTITIQDALSNTFWPGRCHTVRYPIPTANNLTMNLRCDGAHTPLSIRACMDWFQKVVADSGSNGADAPVTSQQRKFLIFNCGHDRNPIPLLYSLYTSNVEFDSIYFCRADVERPSAVPKRLEEAWTTERLASELDVVRDEAVVDLTFQSMCRKLQTMADAATGHTLSMVVQDGGIPNLLSELSASTTLPWQETLANVWKVIDVYSRQLESGGGAAAAAAGGCGGGSGGGSELLECGVRIVTGLNVKDALTSIREEFTSFMTIEDSTDASGSKSASVEVCVTGSLYIVGSALAAAGWDEGNTAD